MAWWTWISWQAVSGVLDVLLISFLIYRILLLVRGTRAQQMLLGLFVVCLVYVASRHLNLIVLNWILGNFLGSVILVVVVLFQDDLRRALIKVGLGPGFNSEAPQQLELTVKEVSRAASELSAKRIGALMVITRDVGLEEYTEHAVKVDAVVSHQLLTSIFYPTSPLHDGAVIIDNNRVIVAGAVLPLTFSTSLSSSYGTRHRAALGLSERTDAVIVVVSEETGGISLVREGRMTKDLNEKTLYNALHRLTVFRQHKQQERKRRKVGSKPSAATEAALVSETAALSEEEGN